MTQSSDVRRNEDWQTNLSHLADCDLEIIQSLLDLKDQEREAKIAEAEKCKDNALHIALQYSQIDGAHHKAWAIDQMVRGLLGDKYEAWVAEHNKGEEGDDTYSWDVGIAP